MIEDTRPSSTAALLNSERKLASFPSQPRATTTPIKSRNLTRHGTFSVQVDPCVLRVSTSSRSVHRLRPTLDCSQGKRVEDLDPTCPNPAGRPRWGAWHPVSQSGCKAVCAPEAGPDLPKLEGFLLKVSWKRSYLVKHPYPVSHMAGSTKKRRNTRPTELGR